MKTLVSKLAVSREQVDYRKLTDRKVNKSINSRNVDESHLLSTVDSDDMKLALGLLLVTY